MMLMRNIDVAFGRNGKRLIIVGLRQNVTHAQVLNGPYGW